MAEEEVNNHQEGKETVEEETVSDKFSEVEEAFAEESELVKLEGEIMDLEKELEEELETEVLEIDSRLNKLKEGLKLARQFEEQIEELEKELAAEKEEKEKYVNRLRRLQADFSNYKKRKKKEKKKMELQATKSFVEDLLPIIDNFERALETSQESEEVKNVLEGVEMIYNQLIKLLHKKDVEEIPTIGEEFDPNFHEAVMKESDDEHESGVIIEELQKGYKLEDMVIRPAMVKVAE